MQKISFVTKRNGSLQPFDESKIIDYLTLASAGLDKINVELVYKSVSAQLMNNMSTTKILDILINCCIDRIDLQTPDYQYLAARLQINAMRRDVWQSWLPKDTLYHRVKSRVNKDIYDSVILKKYSPTDFAYIESNILNHERDLLLTYAGVRQFLDKFLIKDRISGKLFETPQEANILICMYMFMNYDQTKRNQYIKLMYDKLSTFVISLPTPIYAGVRSIVRSFSSCCVIDCGDSTRSILSTTYIIGDAITKRYGIGVNIGKIRGIGASINNGSVIHTGVVPFLKMFEATTKGFVQNGIRGGGGTISFPFWHWEVMTLLELKNNKGVVENRVRSLDYSIGLNKYFIQKALKNENIYLFSPEQVPLLSNDYTYDYDSFVRVYENYVNDPNIRKQVINGKLLLIKIIHERYETGRIYIYFMDNMNNYGVFNESIFSSNLCQEIALPTRPCELIADGGVGNISDDGLVSVCILSCINVGRLVDTDNFTDLEQTCDIIVRFLNEMIDYQIYDFEQLRRSAQNYRPLGIGISDVFHLLAKKHLKYDTVECRDYIHKLTEHFQYFLLKASCNLAREKGQPCKEWLKSKYSRDIMPMDRYKSNVDELTSEIKYYCDWQTLRDDIKKYGMYNTCLSAVPPTATSSSISNSTPGIDPPRSELTTKVSKYGAVKQIIPEYEQLKNFYTLSRHVNNTEYFKLIGVIQKFIDQGISTNSYYMSTSDVSDGDVIKEVVSAYKYGLKSLYYLNSNKGVDEDISKAFSADGIYESTKFKAYSNNNQEQTNDEQTDEDNDDEGCSGGACSI